MIGISLPYEWLLCGEGGFGLEKDETLRALKENGVDSIELRTVLARHSAEDVLSVCNMLWDMGFNITVHYLFNTGGYHWAMDPAFRYARHLAKTPARVAELLSDVELMVITHGHVDHFEDVTVRLLARCDMLWVIPDFLLAEALSLGIRREKIIVARPNEPICIGKLTILPFMGRHFRPTTGAGVDEYGYYITADGAPSMAFPADVRDYSTEGLPDIPRADCCFCHVWLGDGNSFDAEHTDKACEIARFIDRFTKKHVILSHLYESGRRDADMWRIEHAEEVAAAIREINPGVRISIPRPGEIIKP